MKQIIIILTILFMGCQPKKQDSFEFKITVFDLSNPKDSGNFSHWQKTHISHKKNTPIDTLFSQDSIAIWHLYYSDNQYLVYGRCMGEFGGDLFFQDKNSKDSIYYLACTCPVMIDKRDDGYYITESLAHLSGSGKIQFIKSPKELVSIHVDSLITKWKIKRYPKLTEYEIWNKLENQGKVLIDTTGVTFNIFFPNHNNNYLIYSDYQNTYLGLFSNGTLQIIDTLLFSPTWSSNTYLNEKINGYYHYTFKHQYNYSDEKIMRNNTSSGDIYAKGDSIIIAYNIKNHLKKKKFSNQ